MLDQIFNRFVDTFEPISLFFGLIIILFGLVVLRGRLYAIKKGFVYKTFRTRYKMGVGEIRKEKVDQTDAARHSAFGEAAFIIILGLIVLFASYYYTVK